MRISDGSSDVCSSDLQRPDQDPGRGAARIALSDAGRVRRMRVVREGRSKASQPRHAGSRSRTQSIALGTDCTTWSRNSSSKSEEHTSELQSLMRTTYAVLCMKKKTQIITVKHNKLQ